MSTSLCNNNFLSSHLRWGWFVDVRISINALSRLSCHTWSANSPTKKNQKNRFMPRRDHSTFVNFPLIIRNILFFFRLVSQRWITMKINLSPVNYELVNSKWVIALDMGLCGVETKLHVLWLRIKALNERHYCSHEQTDTRFMNH